MIKKIVIVGMGYVGIPVAALFADKGFEVVGINRSKEKIIQINNGECPIEGDEPKLKELVKKVVKSGKLKATDNYGECRNADAILICVETPFDKVKDEPNYSSLKSALKQVGKKMGDGTLVVIESTIAPKTMDNLVKHILEAESGMKAGCDFYLGHCPERVMPGKLINNIVNLPRVCGGINETSKNKMEELYSNIVTKELYKTDCLTAEVVKTTENAYRDVEIAFANEIAMLCEKLKINVYEVRELVNKSPFRNMHVPGAGVGGHCLPKDSLLLAYSTKNEYDTRMLKIAREINDEMPKYIVELLEYAISPIKGLNVAICGYAYLENSDDTRNTPSKTLYDELKKRKVNIKIHDPYVKETDGITINKDIFKTIKDADALIFMTAHKEYKELDLKKIRKAMKVPLIIDGRNIFNKEQVNTEKIFYIGLGKQ